MISFLLFASAQAAIPKPDPDEPVIVVEGERKTDAQIRTEAQAYVKAVAAPAGSADQLGRWNDPICPGFTGATDKERAVTLERIRTIATEAGIRVNKRKDCAPNILVAYTHDPSGVVREVFEKRPHSGRGLPTAARADLVAGGYPIRWWYDFKVESRFGEAPIGDHPALLGALRSDSGGPGAGAGGQIAQSENQSGNIADYSSSIIGSKTRQSIGAAVVVVDVNRVRAQSADAIASFVAMVALAPLKLPPRPVATPTITNLFSAQIDGRSDDLTDWDRAYLAALYRTAANRASKVQAGLMTAKIAKTMRGEN